MMCPRCSVEMKLRKEAKIEIDQCEKCKGIWFDGGELEAVYGKWDWNRLLSVKNEPSQIKCNRCGTMMKLFQAGEVEMDICPKCLSVWLDGNELEQLLMERDLADLITLVGDSINEA